jgi:hypothetical protein
MSYIIEVFLKIKTSVVNEFVIIFDALNNFVAFEKYRFIFKVIAKKFI